MNVTTMDVTTTETTTDVRLTSTHPSPQLQPPHRSMRRRRYLENAAAAVLAAVIIVWTLLPIYNMVMIALKDSGDVFTEHIFPVRPSLDSFGVVLTEGHWYLQNFWRQFGNSIYVSVTTTVLTLLLGTLTSFSLGRMRIRHGWVVSNTALLTYVIPASFLAIPFYRIMQDYGLSNNPWSVIAAFVMFATPYAVIVFQEYGRSIPLELDESGRPDGASPPHLYWRLYLPLMAPALVAIGTYAFLFSWNEYLYQFLLLSSDDSMTVPVLLARFLNSDVAPWNYMMATTIIYAIPPIALYYVFRGRMRAGLTMGGVKG